MFHANAWGLPYACTMLARAWSPRSCVDPGKRSWPDGQRARLHRSRRSTVWIAVLEAFEKNPGRWEIRPHSRRLWSTAAASRVDPPS